MFVAAAQQVPRFAVDTVDGRRLDYGRIWQHRNLVLVSIAGDDSPAAEAYAKSVAARAAELAENEAEWGVTRDTIPGFQGAGAIVADRWGEIHFATHVRSVAELPSADELVEWLRYVAHQCPECQGEAY